MRCELSKFHRFSPHLTTPQTLVKQGFERKSEFRRLSLAELKLTFGELRSSTSCFKTVLREFLSCFPLILRAFPAFCLSVIRCADHKKRPFSFSNSLMKRTIYYPKQFLWFIILHFCIDVHSCFAVFVSGKVLYCLWINACIEKIGDVSVP